MVSHGAATFLRDRLFENYDKYTAYVCKDCGMFSTANHSKQLFVCKSCARNDSSVKDNNCGRNIAKVKIPYAFILLMHELGAMNIAVRLQTSEE